MDDTKRSLTGSMSLRLELGDMNCSDAYAQKMVASIIGSTIHARPVYHKRHIVGGGKGFYFVDGWLVYGRKIRSRHFCLCNMEHYARVIEALEQAGFPLNGYIRITYLPEKFDAMTIVNLRTILQARHVIIKQALELEDDLKIIVTHELALGVPLGAFSMRKIEACSGEEHSKMYSMCLTGYQVPHGGYFIKNTLPAMTLSENGILFNAMCHKRLDGCRFVEVLYHPILQTIILRPSNEDNPNSFEWENDNGKPKQVISTRAFCRAIYDQMEWMNEYRFKFRGIERSRGNTKVLIFALDEPQILVNKPQPNPPEGPVEYINYKRDNTIPKHGKSEQLKGRAFVAYPAELTHGNVGLTYSLKRRLDTISHNLTEEDITSDGVTFVNPMMQKLPTRQEMLDEVDRLLESM